VGFQYRRARPLNAQLGHTPTGRQYGGIIEWVARSPSPALVVYAFLLSDDGTNINGAILASDGGWSAL
jgi:hypothetical protein